MIDYVRPPVVTEDFHDDDGNVIPYGTRWVRLDHDGPEETYSVTQQPERFQPLTDVARAIVEHLAATYAVERDDVDAHTVRIRPIRPDAASITFVFHPFPSVTVTGGASTRLDVMCGCDHCDEGVIDLIDELERSITAVVAGQLTEWDSGFELRDANGDAWQSGGRETADPAKQVGTPRRYAPWQLRSR